MALSEGGRARFAAGAASPSRRTIRHVAGTVVRASADALAVFQADGNVENVRIGRRTLFRLAGRTVTRTDHLGPGRSVRVAYLETEAGPLAVMVELVGARRASPGGRRSSLAIASSALAR